MKQHMGGRNGHGNLAVPDSLEHERRVEAMQAQALNNAKGAFRATIATAASRIAAAMVGPGGGLGLSMSEADMDAIASTSVDLARRIAIKAHGCAFPTAAELGQHDAEQAPQEG